MSQYFNENHGVLTQEREISCEIFDTKFRFLTNNGLFSCSKVDNASLTLLKNMPPIKGNLLDLGCGYGVIGIVLAKINDITLTQSDINGIPATAVHSDGFDKLSGRFDIITLNPPIHAGKEVIYKLYKDSAAFLNPGGSFFLVIQKKHGAESTMQKLKSIFNSFDVLYKKKGVFVIRYFNEF